MKTRTWSMAHQCPLALFPARALPAGPVWRGGAASQACTFRICSIGACAQPSLAKGALGLALGCSGGFDVALTLGPPTQAGHIAVFHPDTVW